MLCQSLGSFIDYERKGDKRRRVKWLDEGVGGVVSDENIEMLR